MNCPNEDKLLGFIDQFLDENETKEIKVHIRTCPSCAQKVEEWESENTFLKETLKPPVLPDDFAETIVSQVTPYKPKVKRRWRWGIGTAASILLAGGIVMAVNPSLADWVGSIFSSDWVDEGLQIAMDTDIATPVNLSVTDAGITFHVEHMIADTSRIALSYFATDMSGEKFHPDFKPDLTLLDEQGEQVAFTTSTWNQIDHYGIVEISLSDVEHFTKGTVQLDIREIDGKKGNWFVQIPVNLTSAYEKQSIVEINEKIEVEDVVVKLNHVNYATSTTEISYMTDYMDEAKRKLRAAIKKKEEQFNKDFVNAAISYFPYISYRIENEEGEVLGYYPNHRKEEHRAALNIMSGSITQDREQIEELDPVQRTDSYVPQREEEKLYFVLDQVYKINAADFSVTFKPNELPYTFQYKGHELTIEAVEQQTDVSYDESGEPMNRYEKLEVHMSGYSEEKAPMLIFWMVEDGAGESHLTYVNGSSRIDLDETDEHGRFKHEIQLDTYGLKDIPEEITLHLVMERETIELENEWRVPLYEKE